jgi:hypothetical protein
MVMCAPDCDCKWCMLVEMADHPLFKEVIDGLLDEFKPLFVTADERQRRRRLTGLEAQVPLHVDDEAAVPEPGLAPDAVDVVGGELELAAGV